jgi:hypothetical protein
MFCVFIAVLTYLSLTAVRLRDERDEWRQVNSDNVEYYRIRIKECIAAKIDARPYDRNWFYDGGKRQDSIDIMKSETPHYRPEGAK